jgi:hypothetical protein
MNSGCENLSKEELISIIILLREELAQLKRMIYGTKSERFVPAVAPEQGTLGFDTETSSAQVAETAVAPAGQCH